MSNSISDAEGKLSAITDRTPVDWDAFAAVLQWVENINTYDARREETILS